MTSNTSTTSRDSNRQIPIELISQSSHDTLQDLPTELGGVNTKGRSGAVVAGQIEPSEDPKGHSTVSPKKNYKDLENTGNFNRQTSISHNQSYNKLSEGLNVGSGGKSNGGLPQSGFGVGTVYKNSVVINGKKNGSVGCGWGV